MVKGELAFVEWLRERCKLSSECVMLGIGDDMAVVAPGSDQILVTSDMLLDGVHFDTRTQPLELIGRKALACSLSDCAAMAVQPIAATVSLALPRSFTMVHAQTLYEGLLAMADQYGCAVVGGDTNSWSNPLVIDVTVLARPYPDCRPIRRSGAKVLDLIYVTGPLGGSLRGRHLTFEPRVETAHRLAAMLGERLHAMMDISDGLSLDLHRMCKASGVGARLAESGLQRAIHPDAVEQALTDGRTALDHALSDGEDFELLMCFPFEKELIARLEQFGIPLYMIGQITESGLTVVADDGSHRPLPIEGYEHFR